MKVDDFYSKFIDLDKNELISLKDRILNFYKNNNDDEIKKIYSYFNGRDCEQIGFSTELNLIKNNKFNNYCFNEPMILYWHKRLPLSMLVGDKFSYKKLHQKPVHSPVSEANPWVYTFKKANKKEESFELKEQLKTLENMGIDELKKFVGFLKNKCEFLGFTYNSRYFKIKTESDGQRALYIHPFGGPVMAFKVKNKPIVFVTTPSLKYNDSHLKDLKENDLRHKEIIGETD